MSYKEFKEKHPDIRFLYALVILLILVGVAVSLIFILPGMLKPKANKRSRSVTPSVITSTTSLNTDMSLSLSLGEGESIKISSNAEDRSIDAYENPKFLYLTSSSSTYYIDIEYSVTSISISDISFVVTLSDSNGNNKRNPNQEDISVTNNKLRYLVNGGATDIAIHSIEISYTY